jgi:hypothetical protein
MNVKPEDLMDVVLAADNYRRVRNGYPPCKIKRSRRVWIEPLFNALGWAMGQALVAMPWALRWRADQRIIGWMGARPESASPRLPDVSREIVALAARLTELTGQRPALMIFTSHPETTGDLEWLRFEVMRQGLMLANAWVEGAGKGFYRRAPECFLAIDPFALDSVPTPVAGWYAGFMNRIYIVWDRLSGTQSTLQRNVLLRKTGYATVALRLLRRLKQAVPIVMMLPGGLPQNARLFYAAREFVGRLPVPRWPYSKRLAQKKWMEIVARPVDGVLPAENGEIPASVQAELRRLLAEWGIAERDQERQLEDFSREFRQTVPYRTRLFRFLLNRLVARGKPLMWVAVSHRDRPPFIQIASPWAAYRATDGGLRLIRGAGSAVEPLSDSTQMTMDFSKEFVV